MPTCPDILVDRFHLDGQPVSIPCELAAGHDSSTLANPTPHYCSGIHVEHNGAWLHTGPLKWVGRKVMLL